MPALYQVKIYKNTGFNTSNIPASTAALPVGYDAYDAVFEWQNKGIASVKIKASWDQVKNADYLELSKGAEYSYFLIDGVQMESPMTARLSLIFDPILSAGGVDALTIIGGWTKRAAPSSDELFANVIPEPWTPSAPLKIVDRSAFVNFGYPTVPEMIGTQNFVIATCDIRKADEIAAAVATASEGTGGDVSEIIFPLLPSMEGSPGSTVIFAGGSFKYTLPFMYIFHLGSETAPRSDLIAKVDKINSLGLQNGIINSFSLRGEDIGAITVDATGFVSSITGYFKEHDPNSPFRYSTYTPKNAKAYALYNQYTLFSMSSGSSIDFEAYDLAGEDSPTFIYEVDPAPSGTCYMRPKTFRGQDTQETEQSVSGAQWLTAGILYTGTSESLIQQTNLARQIRTDRELDRATREGYDLQNIQRAFNSGAGLLQAGLNFSPADLADPVGTALNAVSGAGNYIMNDLAARHAQDVANFNRHRQIGDKLFEAALLPVKSPTLAFPVNMNASAYFGNRFYILHTGLSDGDLARLDKWLTAYGYAQDKILEKSDMTNRQKFNYIMTEDAQVTVAGLSEHETDQISDILNRGIRLWHVPPTAAAYNDNPAKEVS